MPRKRDALNYPVNPLRDLVKCRNRLSQRCHQFNYRAVYLAPSKHSRRGNRREGWFQRDENRPWVGQLTNFPRREGDAITGSDFGKQRAQALHPVEQPRREADLLAGAANHIIPSGKSLFIEADEIFVFQLSESDPFP